MLSAFFSKHKSALMMCLTIKPYPHSLSSLSPRCQTRVNEREQQLMTKHMVCMVMVFQVCLMMMMMIIIIIIITTDDMSCCITILCKYNVWTANIPTVCKHYKKHTGMSLVKLQLPQWRRMSAAGMLVCPCLLKPGRHTSMKPSSLLW